MQDLYFQDPFNPRENLYGGCTNVIPLGDIRYVDVNSLYPHVLKYKQLDNLLKVVISFREVIRCNFEISMGGTFKAENSKKEVICGLLQIIKQDGRQPVRIHYYQRENL